MIEALLILGGSVLTAVVVSVPLSMLLIRPSIHCVYCFKIIQGWVWMGSDDLVRRWERHVRESCEVIHEEREYRRATLSWFMDQVQGGQ